MTQADLIALDADGVLIDYHEGYARGWEKAFGYRPKVKNPQGYHPRHYWDVPALDANERAHFNDKGMSESTWRDMPAMPGAKEACEMLQAAGFRLVCVTALSPKYEAARAANLHDLGIRVEAVHAVGYDLPGNPKVLKLAQLRPRAFVDDLLAYLQGVPPGTWRALVEGRKDFNPNLSPRPGWQKEDGRHASLLDFARWATSPADPLHAPGGSSA